MQNSAQWSVSLLNNKNMSSYSSQKVEVSVQGNMYVVVLSHQLLCTLYQQHI